jgi:rsbT co-antagonist protein RsbR
MTNQLQAFGAFLRTQAESRFDELAQQIRQAGTTYEKDENAYNKIFASYLVLAEAIENNDMNSLIEASKVIGSERARSGFGIHEVMVSSEMVRHHIWKLLIEYMEDNGEWSPEPIQRLEDFIHTFQINVSAEFGKVLEQAREELQEKSEQLEAQRQTIRELGTPILPVHEGVLVLPLVGVVDSNRATQVMEILLEAISSYQADLVIIDITGVPVVDTSVANYILQAARATKLIGAQVILVGIGAEIAQTMVHLGVDLSDIITLANLQEGLQYAFERLGISLETI